MEKQVGKMNLKTMTIEDISNISAHTQTFNKGKKYFQLNNVLDLSINKEKSMYEAEVAGNELYKVEIGFDSSLNLNRMECSCPADEAYSGPCKHVVAALIAISEDKKGQAMLSEINADVTAQVSQFNVTSEERKRTSQLIESFEQLYVKKQETFHEREALQVEYTIKLESTFSKRIAGAIELELKIGPKRLYVVKSITDLLKAVEENEALKFSKLFTYHPSDYFFEEEDIEIFRKMSMILDMKKSDEPAFSYSYLRRTAEQQRSFHIPSSYVMEMLQLLQPRKIVIEDAFSPLDHFEISTGKPPLEFSVVEDSSNQGIYRMKWEGAMYAQYFGKRYGLLYLLGTFYPLEGAQLEAFDSLFFQMVLEDTPELLVEENQLETFASVVLPRLREIGDVSLSDSIRENIQMSPLVAKLYVDYNEERATAEVVFQYGEVTFSPFKQTEKEGNQLIVRDVEKEFYLLSYIENVPFKFNGTELYLDDIEEILHFVSYDIPELSELFHLYATSNLRNVVYQPLERPAVKVETNEKFNYLDVEFEIEGISEEEMSEVLRSLLDNKKYYRLDSGAYLHLQSEEFQGMKQVMEDLEISSKDASASAQVPMYRAFQLSETNEVLVKRDRAFKKLIERLTDPEEIDFPIPAHLDDVLRDYQKRGFQWLMSLSYYGFGGILADDMGLGKTLQTIAYLQAVKEEYDAGPALVICPSSVVYNWQKEIERFAPTLTTAIISGSLTERKEVLEQAKNCDVWITSYPLIRRDIKDYEEQSFTTMVLDEAQYIKNEGTLTAKAVKAIKASKSFALSGTPIENSLDELFSILSVVQPGIFKNRHMYKNMEEARIAKRIKPFVMRRMKKDVLTELPEKIESVEYTNLTKDQKALYLGQLQLLQAEASSAIQENKLQENRMKILAGLTRLRQICCHPGMFLKEYEGSSGKLERLMEYLEEARNSGRRVVLFSQFTTMLSIIKSRLFEAGRDYHYLDGSTPGKDRVELAERFNNGEKDLFLVSLKAGGTGLNLTGGDTVILFDSWWNPAVEEQAADRVYRYGQKQVVQVTKMITTGTIEEKIHKLQAKKRDLLDRVIQPGETMITSLGKDDIEELLDLKSLAPKT
ncbi:hypothetical protein CR203_16650 [Salipaludibacillus neizhouensis]|uniref:Helicase SNF2 n=2 Tax=Salipaludibacillus neizhouensis TaxID=885475 RepID=A0A3A9KF39_9BACI|nr:hypothetical protein CR203_16650 [Salipaludibacillus neizhouensis]